MFIASSSSMILGATYLCDTMGVCNAIGDKAGDYNYRYLLLLN